MALVEYSGSEDSDQEESKLTAGPIKSKSTSSGKPAFQKLVDSSNPHKIRVNLPEISNAPAKEPDGDAEPPAKRPKIGSGGLGDFNSFLPAPKRPAAPNNGIRIGGLGRGVNLKTGAAPGFTREPMPIREMAYDREDSTGIEDMQDKIGTEVKKTGETQLLQDLTQAPPTEELPKRKATMFKPLSVARKPQKKKKPPSAEGSSVSKPRSEDPMPQAISASKVSLFSTGDTFGEAEKREGINTTRKGAYQPILYQPTPNLAISPDPAPADPSLQQQPPDTSKQAQEQAQDQEPQSLTSIAATLNLSASQTRQLLGRHHNSPSSRNPQAINIINFNTDQEYQANEELRQSGEAVQHNPIRGIAPGKHSLKQLVNAAANQKEALEESFASGKGKRKEAGGRYGW